MLSTWYVFCHTRHTSKRVQWKNILGYNDLPSFLSNNTFTLSSFLIAKASNVTIRWFTHSVRFVKIYFISNYINFTYVLHHVESEFIIASKVLLSGVTLKSSFTTKINILIIEAVVVETATNETWTYLEHSVLLWLPLYNNK